MVFIIYLLRGKGTKNISHTQAHERDMNEIYTKKAIFVNFYTFTHKNTLPVGKVFLCRIEGVNDIDAAKKLTKHEIFIEVADDEYIDPETLMGKEIYDKQTKQLLGKVVDYGDFGGGMLVLAKKGKEETWHLVDTIMIM